MTGPISIERRPGRKWLSGDSLCIQKAIYPNARGLKWFLLRIWLWLTMSARAKAEVRSVNAVIAQVNPKAALTSADLFELPSWYRVQGWFDRLRWFRTWSLRRAASKRAALAKIPEAVRRDKCLAAHFSKVKATEADGILHVAGVPEFSKGKWTPVVLARGADKQSYASVYCAICSVNHFIPITKPVSKTTP